MCLCVWVGCGQARVRQNFSNDLVYHQTWRHTPQFCNCPRESHLSGVVHPTAVTVDSELYSCVPVERKTCMSRPVQWEEKPLQGERPAGAGHNGNLNLWGTMESWCSLGNDVACAQSPFTSSAGGRERGEGRAESKFVKTRP